MLDSADRASLLSIARAAIADTTHDRPAATLDVLTLSAPLREPRATFVTLHTVAGQLRGCIGGLEASMPLALDAQQHAIHAAVNDPRFPPVAANELPLLLVEISVLTPPERIATPSPDAILAALRPHTDGVLLKSGYRRATFLPQVWQKVAEPLTFMDLLSEKMGLAPEAWRLPSVEVYRYQVESFAEERPT